MAVTYWDLILKEIKQKKDDPSATYHFIHRKEQRSNHMQSSTKPEKTSTRKKYALGDKYPNIYFSQQEAECMRYALKGKTITGIAVALDLSPRTVEYYFQKMRWKLQCHSKSELIGKVSESDFLKSLESA